MKDIAAIYCRLSKEDLDKDFEKTESESIKNQKSMLEAYAADRNWSIYDYYIDEDYSGSDRDRPGFNRLITDSLLGRFNIVLCKKQSRFARDIEFVEKYIHGLFAEQQIRFIAVLDSIDTGAAGRSVRKASQINSLVDEWYLSDLSENIISALTTKRKNAEFIGSWAPYGYRKNPENKNQLIPDESAAKIVRQIFEWYRSGWGISRIARELNAVQIPNPLLYKLLNGEKINPNPQKLTEKRYYWSPATISSVLRNQVYIGAMVQGKFKKASYRSKKLLRIPKSDWIVISGCQEPIIEQETWNAVQKMLDSRHRVPLEQAQPHFISGKVFCGECGSRLVASGGRSGNRKTSYFCCSKHKLHRSSCPGARIEAARLEQLLLSQIRSLGETLYDASDLAELIDSDSLPVQAMRTKLMTDLNGMQARSALLDRKKEILYQDRLNDIITPEQYQAFRKGLEQELLALRPFILKIEADLSRMDENSHPADQQKFLNSHRFPDTLTHAMVEHLIDSVYVSRRNKGEPQQIQIKWNF